MATFSRFDILVLVFLALSTAVRSFHESEI